MTDPTLTCPTCRTEIKLTESLAAPLIADTRKRYEDQLARMEAEVATREAAIREQQKQITAARETIEAEVAAKLDRERATIAAAETQKAKRLVAIDLEHKVKQIADLNEVLKQRDSKLAEAQQAQADLIRKQRELDDAKREMDLTIQKQVQAELGAVRDKTLQETEAALTLRVREKEEQIASMQRQIEDLKRKAEHSCKVRFKNSRSKLSCAKSFLATCSNPCPRVNSAATSFNVWSGQPDKSAGRFCGRPSVPRTGATVGLANCAKTRGRPRLTSR